LPSCRVVTDATLLGVWYFLGNKVSRVLSEAIPLALRECDLKWRDYTRLTEATGGLDFSLPQEANDCCRCDFYNCPEYASQEDSEFAIKFTKRVLAVVDREIGLGALPAHVVQNPPRPELVP